VVATYQLKPTAVLVPATIRNTQTREIAAIAS
jgi:hypothetical protein